MGLWFGKRMAAWGNLRGSRRVLAEPPEEGGDRSGDTGLAVCDCTFFFFFFFLFVFLLFLFFFVQSVAAAPFPAETPPQSCGDLSDRSVILFVF